MSGGIKLKTEVLDRGACSLCGACLDWCPYLKNIEDHLVMAFDCNVEEGRCYAACPRTFTNWQEVREKTMPGVVASPSIGPSEAVYKVKSSRPLHGQQDGGTVTALVKTALENDLAAAALLTGSPDNLTPQPVVGDLTAAAAATGSRFLAAASLRKLVEARSQGLKSLVVVGRPCQIQALRKMQVNRPEALPPDGIITIGLFCLWSLSWKFKDYIEKEWPGSTVRRVAIPRHAMEVTTDQGVRTLSTDKVKEFVRPGCYYCLDMTAELADIAVGALEAEPGWNTVIIRTDKGRDLLKKARAAGSLTIEAYPAAELERLQSASINKKIRGLKTLKAAFEDQSLVPFLDLTAEPYQAILAQAEGEVHD